MPIKQGLILRAPSCAVGFACLSMSMSQALLVQCGSSWLVQAGRAEPAVLQCCGAMPRWGIITRRCSLLPLSTLCAPSAPSSPSLW